jgi:hypothetical protein
MVTPPNLTAPILQSALEHCESRAMIVAVPDRGRGNTCTTGCDHDDPILVMAWSIRMFTMPILVITMNRPH